MGESREAALEQLAREAGQDWAFAARLARWLVLVTRAQLVLEVGLNTGLVTLWLADAVAKTGGRVIACDRDEKVIERVTSRLEDFGLIERVQILYGDAHQTVRTVAGAIDLVRLAADRSGYSDYLASLHPRLRPGAILWAEGVDHAAAQPFCDMVSTLPTLVTLRFPVCGGTVLGLWWPEEVVHPLRKGGQ